jgi:hypothetical protein
MMDELIGTIRQLAFSNPIEVAFLLFVLIFIFVILKYFVQRNAYMKSEYYSLTQTPFFTLKRDIGLTGEYRICKYLSALEGKKKFLINCYIPKDNNNTTEIDIILLHSSGIYVFESKNYSGWIFGSESQKQWTQTFPNRQKERFYNPIMQNNTHIKWLMHLLPEFDNNVFRSIIVFSERCELKKIEITSNKHSIIKRNQLLRTVKETAEQQMLSDDDIERVYQKLIPFTQVSEQVKEAHIDSISGQSGKI